MASSRRHRARARIGCDPWHFPGCWRRPITSFSCRGVVAIFWRGALWGSKPQWAGGVTIRVEYHRDAATFAQKTAEANTAPSLLEKQRLVLSAATKILTTFGPDQGYIAEPETGLIIASRDVVAHDMVSLAWLLENQRSGTPAEARDGVLNDPNQSELLVDLVNRVVNLMLDSGLGGAWSAETLERWDLDTVWDDRVLARGFEMRGGAPRLDLAPIDASVPAAVRKALVAATTIENAKMG